MSAQSTNISPSSAELCRVLQSSLYPGASDSSIALVVSYCQAAGLDPMQKPVHIVPMWSKAIGGMQDVIMPGVGLYRTQAARTKQLAGISEPEFGPMLTQNIGGVEVTYPEWCKVTVFRQMDGGHIAKFTAVEYWLENYAEKGGKEKSIAPNAMWAKRARGQLAKCAQAQALRTGFPEVGSAPTAEELEGKQLDANDAPRVTVAAIPAKPQMYPEADFERNLPKWRAAIEAGRTAADLIALIETKAPLTPGQRGLIEACEPIEAETAL